MNPVLDLSPGLSALPVIYGSGDFALEASRRLAQQQCDCLAVALPPSVAEALERGVGMLPQITVVVQPESAVEPGYTCVPVDPCQGVIAAIRAAVERGIDRAYVDLEVGVYEECRLALPDPYALKQVALERFLAALLPALPPPAEGSQRQGRIHRMAYELHCLELEYRHIVFICSAVDWPWIRQAYLARAPYPQPHANPGLPQLHRVAEEGLYFVLGELPYITHLYEHRRAELVATGSLAIDGLKALLLEARDAWVAEQELDCHWLTPQRLSALLKYVRNLTLMDRLLTPDLYNLALGAKQVVGDDFALALVEVAREYPPQRMPSSFEDTAMGQGRILDPDGEVRPCKNRLAGVPRTWRRLPLKPTPPPPQRRQWSLLWEPSGQCSFPAEDRRIESFQQHVREQAKLLLGEEQTRVEKFTASLKDGLDIRETLRNWHTGDLYVRELPPSRGSVEVVVFLFEVPAAPARYTWCSTWYAEHEEESTLCFFATPFAENMVGPGIAQAVYGGCSFLYPPRPVGNVWQDREFDFARTLEERLLAGALYHSQERRVVLVAPEPPCRRWRQLARWYHRQFIYLPLRRFSPPLVDRLRRFHVLNSKSVRSYASRFIRDLR